MAGEIRDVNFQYHENKSIGNAKALKRIGIIGTMTIRGELQSAGTSVGLNMRLEHHDAPTSSYSSVSDPAVSRLPDTSYSQYIRH